MASTSELMHEEVHPQASEGAVEVLNGIKEELRELQNCDQVELHIVCVKVRYMRT